jgi:hypothetical protein
MGSLRVSGSATVEHLDIETGIDDSLWEMRKEHGPSELI